MRKASEKEAEAVGKFDGVLFCSDIDATLLLNGELPEENRRAIKYFQSEGGRFTLCTGRYLDFFDKYAHLVTPNAPVVAMNGTIIVDKESGEKIYTCALPADPGEMVANTLTELPYLIAAYVYPEGAFHKVKRTEDGRFEATYLHAPEHPARYASDARGLNEIFGYPASEMIYKVVFTVSAERSDEAKAEIAERFKGFSVFRSWINGIEVQSPEADKGKGARMLARLLGDVKLLVCAGDYENDISMIKEADIGYAVAGAHPALKAVADRVTKRDCLEGAIAEMIYDLDRELG